MAKCLNEGCSNEVVTKEGKRARKTCSDSCRQQVWQREKQNKYFVKIPREEWEKLVKERNETPPLPLMPLIRTTPNFKKESIDDRTNSLINSARGRDESGINEDEVHISPKIIKKIEKASVSLPKQKEGEFRAIMKGEDGLDYSIAKREFLNNQ